MLCSASESLFERSKKVSPGGVHSPVRAFRGVGGTPPFIESALGAELKDVEGKTYLDFCLSWGPLIFGHQCPEVKEAVIRMLDRGWSYGTAEPYSLELAEWIVSEIPWIEKIRFVSSGTEAVMSALRLARGVTGRKKILKFEGCYHGHTDSMLVRAGSGLADLGIPESAGVSAVVAGETIVVPLNDQFALEAAFNQHGADLAAAIIEPIPANYGLLIQAPWFLTELSRLCRHHQTLLIFDEVITGFRTGLQGMAGCVGIQPDLVTYGKILGGGFPAAAYGGKAEIMDHVAPAGLVYQAGTLSANPVAMVAGLAMLKKLKKDHPYPILEARTRQWAASAEVLAQKNSVPLSVQSFGSLFWMILGGDTKAVRAISEIPSNHKQLYSKLFHQLLARGLYLAPSAYEVSFLSTAHSSDQLERSLILLEESFEGLMG